MFSYFTASDIFMEENLFILGTKLDLIINKLCRNNKLIINIPASRAQACQPVFYFKSEDDCDCFFCWRIIYLVQSLVEAISKSGQKLFPSKEYLLQTMMAIILIEYHYAVPVQKMISFTFQAEARSIRVSELIEQRRMRNNNANNSSHIFILLVFSFLS